MQLRVERRGGTSGGCKLQLPIGACLAGARIQDVEKLEDVGAQGFYSCGVYQHERAAVRGGLQKLQHGRLSRLPRSLSFLSVLPSLPPSASPCLSVTSVLAELFAIRLLVSSLYRALRPRERDTKSKQPPHTLHTDVPHTPEVLQSNTNRLHSRKQSDHHPKSASTMIMKFRSR